MILYDISSAVTEGEKQAFLSMMEKAGRVDRLPEALIDAGCAVSGCGPAFAFLFAEALADGGVYEPQNYESCTIDPLGRYYTGYLRDSEILEVRSSDGRLLCERPSEEKVKFFTADNLVRFWRVGLAGTEEEIINLSTGECLETGRHDVIDGNGNLWICNANSSTRSEERYVLGADFNHLDIKIVGDGLEFSDDGKYLYGQLHVPSDEGNAIKAQNFVADSEGNIIYKGAVSDYFSNGQVGDVRIVEVIGDILLLSERVDQNQFRYDCIMLDQSCEMLFENDPGHCFIDFDDGIAACNIINDPERSGMAFSLDMFNRLQRIDDFRWTEWYDWYYMKKDGTVYDFNFEFGMPTKDGYAAVKSEKKWGVVRFRE
jgi:hypothetical protein